MNHSRDDKEVGAAYKVKSPENQPQFFLTMMGQYWLGPNKLSKSYHAIQKKIFNRIFY